MELIVAGKEHIFLKCTMGGKKLYAIVDDNNKIQKLYIELYPNIIADNINVTKELLSSVERCRDKFCDINEN